MIKPSDLENIGIKVYKINGDEVYGFCPLHNDQRPSFGFNLRTEKYLCRAGCICGNSYQDLVMKVTGKIITPEMSEKRFTERLKEIIYHKLEFKKIPMIPIIPLAINNFGETYLFNRKINEESIRKWNIMYWESINGIVIPIEDIGYVIRYIDAEKTRDKYKYVSGTKITNSLFGLKNLNFQNNKYIIITEGCLDAIYMHQIGFENTMALLHSDISNIQRKILIDLQLPLCVMMDSDEAGNKAFEVIKRRIDNNLIVKKCILPEGRDPNSCDEYEIKKSIGEAKI